MNIRRYVDTSAPVEPHDVRAHLVGGIPRGEVEAVTGVISAHGLDAKRLLVPQDDRYFKFVDGIDSRDVLKTLIARDAGVQRAETEVKESIRGWWSHESARFDSLTGLNELVGLRVHVLETFPSALLQFPILDRFTIQGVAASWWSRSLPDFKALANLGYKGLVEAWCTTVLDALTEEKAKLDPLEHKVARALLPDYLLGLASLEDEVARLEGLIKVQLALQEEAALGELVGDEAPTPQEIKQLKAKTSAARKQLRSEKSAFADRLEAASTALDDVAARDVVLTAFLETLIDEADSRLYRRRKALVALFEKWWDKYYVSLGALNLSREMAARTVNELMAELAYGDE